MSIEIFYFSGTGNSLFIAKELIKHFPDGKLTPIVKALNNNNCITNTDTIGFVFPVHALTIPIIVKRFINKLNIDSVNFIFAIATRGGTSFHGFKKIEQILKKKKHKLNARFIINMVLNDSRSNHFSIPSEEIVKKDDIIYVENIAKKIIGKANINEPDNLITIKTAKSKLATTMIEGIVLLGMNIADKTKGVNYFYHNENCTKCGVCVRVCLSGKINNTNGSPEWQKSIFCYMCYACINYCPSHSIQIRDIPGVKSYTIVNGRYHHPYAKISDIEAQKS
jgi:Pyruvate/2-oxoacid:ferredoxin oxidoreductase delta subunit